MIDAIPIAELSTAEPLPIDPADPCASVTADVVTPEIGAAPRSMAESIDEHKAMSTGRAADRLAHLTWLRIDDHYAIERILEFDPSKSCMLTLDPATGHPTESAADRSVRTICPVTRAIARKLLDNVTDEEPEWWESVINPTG